MMPKRALEKRSYPVQPLEERTSILLDGLADALDIFRQHDKEAGEIGALHAVIAYLFELGVPHDLLTPIDAVINEIYDSRTRLGHATRVGDAQLMAHASAFMTLFHKERGRGSGAEDAAAKDVELASGRKIRAGQVKAYRKRIRAGTAPAIARDFYEDAVKRWSEILESYSDPVGRRNMLMASARKILIVGKTV
jgi:hypothetical protein